MLNVKNVFNVKDADFEPLALQIFSYQAQNNKIYKSYLKHLNTDVSAVDSIKKIPFLPISFFKTHKILADKQKEEIIFSSSGTTGMQTSSHFVADLKLYEQSFLKGFQQFYGDVEEYCILALLPSYIEKGGSSLVYMTKTLIEKSKHSQSGFYLHNLDDLANTLETLNKKGQKTLLIGVSYALLDLIEKYQFNLKNTIVLETGGMKGYRKEMIKEEFYAVLKKGFGVSEIHSEYGMTELLSQAYSYNNGRFKTVPWLKILIRDINDPFDFLPLEKSGGINIIDLANIYSCSFIATQDLGKNHSDGTFSILGRFDDSDIRGCNLLVQ